MCNLLLLSCGSPEPCPVQRSASVMCLFLAPTTQHLLAGMGSSLLPGTGWDKIFLLLRSSNLSQAPHMLNLSAFPSDHYLE